MVTSLGKHWSRVHDAQQLKPLLSRLSSYVPPASSSVTAVHPASHIVAAASSLSVMQSEYETMVRVSGSEKSAGAQQEVTTVLSMRDPSGAAIVDAKSSSGSSVMPTRLQQFRAPRCVFLDAEHLTVQYAGDLFREHRKVGTDLLCLVA